MKTGIDGMVVQVV